MLHQFSGVTEYDILKLWTEGAAKFGFFCRRGVWINPERGLQISDDVAEMVLVLLLILGLGLVLVSSMTLRAVEVLDHLLNVLLLGPPLSRHEVPTKSSRLSSQSRYFWLFFTLL